MHVEADYLVDREEMLVVNSQRGVVGEVMEALY